MPEVAELAYPPAVAAATAPIYDRMKRVVPAIEWPLVNV